MLKKLSLIAKIDILKNANMFKRTFCMVYYADMATVKFARVVIDNSWLTPLVVYLYTRKFYCGHISI